MKEQTINYSDKNIYSKMQIVKFEITQRELKKTGENTYSGFKYYELGDFMPSLIELCKTVGLFTHIDFVPGKDIITKTPKFIQKTENANNTEITKTEQVIEQKIEHTPECAILTIINCDNPEEKVEYHSEVKKLDLKGANDIQNYGGVQTYLRRYLYMNAFDIVEADMFDNEDFELKQTKKKEKPNLDKVIEQTKLIYKDADKETKTQVGDLMRKWGYTTFKDMAESQNKADIIALAEMLKVKIPPSLLEEDTEDTENK